jgi:hypothetical protein
VQLLEGEYDRKLRPSPDGKVSTSQLESMIFDASECRVRSQIDATLSLQMRSVIICMLSLERTIGTPEWTRSACQLQGLMPIQVDRFSVVFSMMELSQCRALDLGACKAREDVLDSSSEVWDGALRFFDWPRQPWGVPWLNLLDCDEVCLLYCGHICWLKHTNAVQKRGQGGMITSKIQAFAAHALWL